MSGSSVRTVLVIGAEAGVPHETGYQVIDPFAHCRAAYEWLLANPGPFNIAIIARHSDECVSLLKVLNQRQVTALFFRQSNS